MIEKNTLAEMFLDGREAYAAGKNIVQTLLAKYPDNKLQAIEISYSLQSGTYTSQASTDLYRSYRREVSGIIRPQLRDQACASVLDCGVGEGTSWLDFEGNVASFYGLDASFSRLKYCQANLASNTALGRMTLVKGNMTSIPFSPESIDVVITMHAIEPNNDPDAEEILLQLFEISRKLVILFEPDYRSATPEMRARMEQHDFAKTTWDTVDRMTSHKTIGEGKLTSNLNPLNQTSYRILQRKTAIQKDTGKGVLCSPVNGSPLSPNGNALTDADNCFAFPILSEIICLAPEDGIFVGDSL
jgi:2-polyprenyl-3-methyl-5-hydroxy-6-metoxy-1,4-benzoquinol methylase